MENYRNIQDEGSKLLSTLTCFHKVTSRVFNCCGSAERESSLAMKSCNNSKSILMTSSQWHKKIEETLNKELTAQR